MKRTFVFTALMTAGLLTSSVLFSSASYATTGVNGPAAARQDSEDSVKLTIGSKAPALDVEHWVQNGEGKFKPVTKFENGKVYIVEFWATW